MKNVLEYLKITAERLPGKTAFEDEENSITFGELRNKARVIGSGLAKKGCQKKPVPILMQKQVSTVELMIGIIYSGGFYVILDPSQPVARLNQILKTLEAETLITDAENLDYAEEMDYSGEIILSEKLSEGTVDAEILKQIEDKRQATDPLYVLFTSGSTGVPKGVVVSHRSVIDFIDEFTEIFSITEDDVLGNQAPFDFDVSVKDIYSALAVGATVELIPREYFSVPVRLLDFLDDRRVTNLTWAVSALTIVSIVDGLSYKRPESIKRIMFSGETMAVRHLNYWKEYYPDARFVNLYGPTEITCNCTYYEIKRDFEVGKKIPIGKNFPNENVFLLDDNNQEVKETGVEGQICVSGTALALGYYNNPEQTAKVFVQNPLNNKWQETIYLTGDLAFYDENGDLVFTSRKDYQIKHMGHRIELGEIEAALEKISAIKNNCCVYDERKNKIICFYQGDIGKKEIVAYARKLLQDFMIPNVFRQMEKLPLNDNGKLDRKALKDSLM